MSVDRTAARRGQSEPGHKSKPYRVRVRPFASGSMSLGARKAVTPHEVSLEGISNIPKVKLQVEVTPELVAIVEGLAKRANVDTDTIMQRAIMLIGIAASATQDGFKVGTARDDQELLTEITGL